MFEVFVNTDVGAYQEKFAGLFKVWCFIFSVAYRGEFIREVKIKSIGSCPTCGAEIGKEKGGD